MIATAAATFPVIEWFGPTVQGEGILAGLPTYFVRFGGCDFRCSWCDSMFSVEPAQVREHAVRMDADGIVGALRSLPAGPEWVTLSGGNPALLKLGELVTRLHDAGMAVAVETQGSRWREWLADVDCLTVSPKPPSSLMVSARHDVQFAAFMERAERSRSGRTSRDDALKIVVFDEADLAWAKHVLGRHPRWQGFLSAGTPPIGQWGSEVTQAVSARQVRDQVGDRYAWLCDRVAGDPDLAHVRVLPQLHVIGFGHARAV